MKYLLGLALAINLVSWGLILFFVPGANFPFIVKYNVFVGKDIFDSRLSLFSLPTLGLIILAINGILALSLAKANRELSLMILGMTCFFEVLIALYAWITIFINTY
jgi:glucose uptake protein GlcU